MTTDENADRVAAGVLVVDGDLTEAVFHAVASSNRVAIDTETTGLDWRRDRLATVQVFAPEGGVQAPEPRRTQC